MYDILERVVQVGRVSEFVGGRATVTPRPPFPAVSKEERVLRPRRLGYGAGPSSIVDAHRGKVP